MQEKTNYKLILAVLQGDDYHEVVYQLNQKGYYATLLHSSGGFLKKRISPLKRVLTNTMKAT